MAHESEFRSVSRDNWTVDIPTRFFRKVPWAKELIKGSFDCLLLTVDWNCLRLIDPKREKELKESIEESAGLGIELRLSRRTLNKHPGDNHRVTIPKGQRKWLWLVGKEKKEEREVCIVLTAEGVVEIWSMQGINRRGLLPKVD